MLFIFCVHRTWYYNLVTNIYNGCWQEDTLSSFREMWQILYFKDGHNISHILRVLVVPTVGRICFLSPWVWVVIVTALSNRYDRSDIVPVLGKTLTSLAGSSLCPLEENQWGRRMTLLRRMSMQCEAQATRRGHVGKDWHRWVKKPPWK